MLKGAGGLALGALGVGSGKAERAGAAPTRQDATPAATGGKRPNVVVVMSDDVGWGDLGCFGGGPMRGAPTPHRDRLAAEGMRFVNCYGQASCTAGRASFITGRIPTRTAHSLVLLPGDPDHLTPETPTVAQFMGEQGYTTVQIGKWHLGDVDEAPFFMYLNFMKVHNPNVPSPALTQHVEEIAQYPNTPSQVHGGPFYAIPPENRPE